MRAIPSNEALGKLRLVSIILFQLERRKVFKMRNECRSRMKNSRNSRNSRNSWNFKNFKKFQEFVNLAKFPRISSLLILSYKGLDFVKFIFSRRFHIFRPLKRILIMKKARPGSSNLVPIYIQY